MSNDKQPSAMEELEESIQNLSSLTDTNKYVLKSLIINFKIKEKEQIEFADQQTNALRDILEASEKNYVGKNAKLQSELTQVKEQNKQLAEAIQCILKSDNDEAKLHSLFKANAILTNYQKQLSNMKHLFIPYELAVIAKEKEFDEPCLALFNNSNKPIIAGNTPVFNSKTEDTSIICAPLYQQIVDWLEFKHNLHLDRVWYNDGVTPPRWVYHLEHIYKGSNFNEAIEEAFKLI